MDGIALIREAKRLRPDLGILAISAGGHYGRAANYLKWAAELGADEDDDGFVGAVLSLAHSSRSGGAASGSSSSPTAPAISAKSPGSLKSL